MGRPGSRHADCGRRPMFPNAIPGYATERPPHLRRVGREELTGGWAMLRRPIGTEARPRLGFGAAKVLVHAEADPTWAGARRYLAGACEFTRGIGRVILSSRAWRSSCILLGERS